MHGTFRICTQNEDLEKTERIHSLINSSLNYNWLIYIWSTLQFITFQSTKHHLVRFIRLHLVKRVTNADLHGQVLLTFYT